jgi:hypothetical protein
LWRRLKVWLWILQFHFHNSFSQFDLIQFSWELSIPIKPVLDCQISQLWSWRRVIWTFWNHESCSLIASNTPISEVFHFVVCPWFDASCVLGKELFWVFSGVFGPSLSLETQQEDPQKN